MALSAAEQKALEDLIAKRDAPDEGDEIWVRDSDGREYRLRGAHATRAYGKLFGDEQAPAAGPGKAPAKKAAKKAAPPPVDDEDLDDDEDDEGEEDPPEQDPPTTARPGNRVHRALGFGSST